MMDHLGQKRDKLTVMMGKLVTKEEGQNREFKPGVYQTNRGRGQTRHNYEQRGFQDRFRSDNNRSNTYRGKPSYGNKIIKVGQDMIQIIEVITETT